MIVYKRSGYLLLQQERSDRIIRDKITTNVQHETGKALKPKFILFVKLFYGKLEKQAEMPMSSKRYYHIPMGNVNKMVYSKEDSGMHNL
jgi:hypothetical protein